MKPAAVMGLLLCLTACSQAQSPASSTSTTRVVPVTTAVPSTNVVGGQAAACRPDQLSVIFRRGGVGAGSEFAALIIRDKTSTSCTLAGRIEVVPLDEAGKPIPVRSGQSLAVEATSLVLTANGLELPNGGVLPTGVVEGEVDLSGANRDDPETGQLCPSNQLVRPASWSLKMALGAVVVANFDPRLSGPDNSASLKACRGNFLAPSFQQTATAS